jgi:hypothetical protein
LHEGTDYPGTNFSQCEESEATQWAVFEFEPTYSTATDLVEDYPTRAAAEACVAALEAGLEVPNPDWSSSAEQGGVAGAYIVTDAVELLDTVASAQAVTDNSGFIVMDDGRTFDFVMTERAPPEPPRKMVAGDILDPVTPIDIAPDLAAVVERMVRADIVPDAKAFAAAMYDAGELLARLGINTNPEA